MKKKLIFLFPLLLFFQSYSQKIVGYLPSYRDASIVQYNKLTHVIFCFVNPNSTGNLVGINTPNINNANYDFNMNSFIIAKNNCYPIAPNGPKLIVSVGGADAGNVRSNNLYNVCTNNTYRATMITQLINFAIQYKLYGIDIDWEFPTSTAAKNAHEVLLSDLRAAINASSNPNLKLGIAVGGETTGSPNHTQYLNANAIQYVDEFNLMAYDLPASYNTNHSDLTNMTALINNWNTFGIPKSKMLLGVPFYGRNAGRTAVSDYKDFTAALSGATLTTAFNGDGPTGTYYYNGKTTLEAKVDLIMNTHCGMGIMIWDLGGDRTDAYSLLTVLYNRMNAVSACTFSKPDLGADVSACGSSATLTVTNVTAASGRTFQWRKDGVLIATTSANNYSISQSGEWSVTVVESCCKKTDDIQVNIANTVSATGATRCGTGTLNLSMVSSGSTYDWFDAATLGKYLATGSTFTTPSISTTTTYYVQQNAGDLTYYTGKAYPASAPQKEYADYSGMAHWANKITVNQTITIKSVDVYYSGQAVTGGARLVAYSSADGITPVYQSTPVNLPAQTSTPFAAGFPVTLTTNLTLPPGIYYMGIYAPGADAQGSNPGFTLDPNGIVTPYSNTYFSIDGRAFVHWGGGFNATGSQGSNYGQLFNWVITTKSKPCTRTSVIATINCPPVITLTSPAEPGPVSHNAGTPLSLTVSASDDGSISSVVYEIREVATNNLVTTVNGGAGPTFAASWTPSNSIQYKIMATATDNTSLTTSTSFVVVDVALPVEWLYIDAKAISENIEVKWASIQEENNEKYLVQRSNDGVHFETIGTVAGAGTATTIQQYSFLDTEPLTGTSYYRILQVDLDGTTSASEMVSVEIGHSISVFPNPFQDHVTIHLDEKVTYSYSIKSIDGKILLSDNAMGTISVGEELNSGTYILEIRSSSGTQHYFLEKIE